MKNLDFLHNNATVNQKTILPAIVSFLLSGSIWLFSSHFSTTHFGESFPIQLLLFLGIAMIIFITLDRFTNRTPPRLLLPIFIIPVAIIAIIYLSNQKSIAGLLALTLIPLFTSFLPFYKIDGIGLLIYAISLGTIFPFSYFFVQNKFVSGYLISLCIILSLSLISVNFPIFFEVSSTYRIFNIILNVLTIITALIVLKNWAVIPLMIISIASFFINQLDNIRYKLTIITVLTLLNIFILMFN
ncbi:hypothetical protein [Pediococcus claussenii]|uniref:Membrane protein n=1 Tax=Pediococcus claussenii (strain ATCC BAA-344 / DSM 14800 / JCM 18046 / KCTC 3811 / LMG 21948 / P06) TaxID=701521 RepID=G8PDW6_PEDCP|nr:hypothetical protein [Pediococcus claussenii]AEV95451.1 putative membrane protein [Pediococcus claussenii ATCC BAA-344]ANZ68977.1 hypothetical protein AYR57_00965 [Pediococcus claussenii]ANZ70793.1 hypothetical protein AYR58_00965 [Pediococcus claussenii]